MKYKGSKIALGIAFILISLISPTFDFSSAEAVGATIFTLGLISVGIFYITKGWKEKDNK